MNTRTPVAHAALFLLLAASAAGAQALDLAQAWRAAQANDAQVAVSTAAAQAGAARRQQAAALWRPQIQVGASAGVAGADSASTGAHFAAPGIPASNGVDFNTSVNSGTSTRWSVSARQPLRSGERSAQTRQLELAADMAELQAQSAQSELMLLTARRYFDLVLAQRHVELLRQQQVAVNRALTEAQDRFALGDKPVTDTHEARARAMALQAQVLVAENSMALAQSVLAQSTGLSLTALASTQPPGDDGQGLNAGPDLAQWQALALEHNLALRLQALQVQSAQQEAAKYGTWAGATLDLVAQVGQERVNGDGDYGSASNRSGQRVLGVQWSMPVFTGGLRDARQQEALRLLDQAQAALEQARQQTSQQVHSVWLALQTGPARLAALQAAQAASTARLDATELGRQVGDRTTLDLLQAQNDASAAALALVTARTELLLGRLQLGALATALDDAQLGVVNAQLAP
ncbi:MAG: TolC family protein [Betaproteobacteria bacterium]